MKKLLKNDGKDIFKKKFHLVRILCKFAIITSFERSHVFVWKNPNCFLKKNVLYVFEKSYYFSRILRQVFIIP